MSSPVDSRTSSDLPCTFGNFDRLTQFKLDAAEIVVSKWRSRVTGLSLVHADRQGETMLVHGHFALATEALDNHAFACSEALRLMVPTGSEKYPYNGALNEIARRSFGQGIIVHSASDHSTYKVETAGSEGFLQILPVYIDHILYPTLTEAAFITRVHHVNGKGEDSGVLYNQVIEETEEDLIRNMLEHRLRQMEHPTRSESRNHFRDRPEVVRTLTVEEVRQYHSTYYVPHNLCLIVIGCFEEGTRSLLQVLQDQVEPNIISHDHSPFPQRPISVEKMQSGIIKDTITVPETDEGRGHFLVKLISSPWKDPLGFLAFLTFHHYWQSLGFQYTEDDDDIDTEDKPVWRRMGCSSASGMTIRLEGVPVKRLEALDEEFMDPLKRIAEEGIDLGRFWKQIREQERLARVRLEDYSWVYHIICDFLHGPEDGSHLEAAMNPLGQLAVLKNWSSKDWLDYLKKYYFDVPCIIVRGKPSMDMTIDREKAEIDRLVTQVQKLGSRGLKQAEQRLRAAIEVMDEPVPDAVLAAFPIPNVKHLMWMTVPSVQEPGIGRRATVEDPDPTIQDHLAADGEDLPFFVQYDHVQSMRTAVFATITLNRVPDHLRPYLPIYVHALLSPLNKNKTGELLRDEQGSAQLVQICGYEGYEGFVVTDTLRIKLEVNSSRYEKAVAWLRDTMYDGEFTKEMLQNAMAIHQKARVGVGCVWCARDIAEDIIEDQWTELVYPKDSLARITGHVKQSAFMRSLWIQIEENPSVVIAAFEELRRCLTLPSSIRFSVRGDILNLERPRSVWAHHFGDVLQKSDLDPVLQRSALDEIGKTAIFVRACPHEYVQARFTAKGPQRFDDPSCPVLVLLLRLLHAKNSHLQCCLRDHGHAFIKAEGGLVSLRLWGGFSLAQVFAAVAHVINSLADGSLEIDNAALATAKSTVIHNVVADSCKDRYTENPFIDSVLLSAPKDWRKTFVGRVQDTTKEDMIKVLRQYLLPLFDATKSVAVVVSSETDAKQLLVARGYEVFNPIEDASEDDDDGEDDGEDNDNGGDDGGDDGGNGGEDDVKVESKVNRGNYGKAKTEDCSEINR